MKTSRSADPMPGVLHPEHALHQTAEKLAAVYEGVFAAETVERYVFESYTALARTAKVKAYLATITAHFAEDRLRALAQSTGAVAKTTPEVLFVCVENAGRSQIAAALVNNLSRGQVHARSAGSMPAEHISGLVAGILAERGIDLTDAFAKPLTDDVVRAADVVVTMGCGDSCPLYPSKTYLDWSVDDPAAASENEVRAIIDQIEGRAEELVKDLL